MNYCQAINENGKNEPVGIQAYPFGESRRFIEKKPSLTVGATPLCGLCVLAPLRECSNGTFRRRKVAENAKKILVFEERILSNVYIITQKRAEGAKIKSQGQARSAPPWNVITMFRAL